MYKKVDTSLNFVEREKEVLEFWKANKVFEKTIELREGAPAYTFYDGPPTANGKPHMGHILTRAMKDIIPRYRTMKGFNVLRKAGWDTHGLPVELEVEKELGLDGKPQIEKYGVEPFIKKCKESVWKYKGAWENMSDSVGYWADMENPYITYDNNYIESVWWAIKTIADKGLLYKGYKIVPYCPRCGTALSSHETAQGYKTVKETSIFVTFPIKNFDCSALVWTTTPWTLPSNVGLCVNAKFEYAKVLYNGEKLLLAKGLIDSVFGEEKPEILETYTGAELVGLEYEPLFKLVDFMPDAKPYRIVEDDYVTLTDGSGIVHIAPAFGEDDARVGRNYDLPFIQLVNDRGQLTDTTPWAGMFVKTADKQIISDIKANGRLFKTAEFEHDYPFCWRCDTPLLYYARESWFIKMTQLKDKLLAFNKSINWIPEYIRDGRMGNFLENIIDWGVSRERYWGTPLPVWVCEKCGEIEVVGSRAQLVERAGKEYEGIELHKPYIDEVTFDCLKCGSTMKREPSVLDCWFDSGSMPFAQWHYPFENRDEFMRRYPADYISEAVDQTRGWFYTLMAISVCLFDEPPFRNCLVLGHVQDKHGIKMSKHKGNVIAPEEALKRQGADAVRWYYYINSSPWLPNRYSHEAVSEAQRKFIGTLWNTYAFYVLYADIDEFDPTKHVLREENITVMDKWVLSRLNTLIKTVDSCLEEYKITEAAREMLRFSDDLSNWYVRRCRERFWGSGMTPDKEAAYMTLYTVLETMARLTAPFTPFLAEMIYQNIVRTCDKNAPVSVHLLDFPAYDQSRIDEQAEENMDNVLALCALGRAARNQANIKNRQPLSEILVQGAQLPKMYVNILAEELNVHNVRFVSDASEYISYRVKPQLKTLGPRYGKLLKSISAHLLENSNEIVKTHAEGRNYEFDLEGEHIVLAPVDVLVETERKEGYASASDNGFTVVLATTLTQELIDEGFVRELVSKVQTMRKEADFNVTDRIVIYHMGNERIADIFDRFGKEICADTLADTIITGVMGGYTKEWDVNGETVTLGVKVNE